MLPTLNLLLLGVLLLACGVGVGLALAPASVPHEPADPRPVAQGEPEPDWLGDWLRAGGRLTVTGFFVPPIPLGAVLSDRVRFYRWVVHELDRMGADPCDGSVVACADDGTVAALSFAPVVRHTEPTRVLG